MCCSYIHTHICKLLPPEMKGVNVCCLPGCYNLALDMCFSGNVTHQQLLIGIGQSTTSMAVMCTPIYTSHLSNIVLENCPCLGTSLFSALQAWLEVLPALLEMSWTCTHCAHFVYITTWFYPTCQSGSKHCLCFFLGFLMMCVP